MDDDHFLPGLPADIIRAAYLNAPGDEIGSGKFANPESSAALVANSFGFFLEDPARLPPLPGTADCGWPAESIALEAILRFPWSGGRHPCLDVLIVTPSALIGVESKRFEPFRSTKEAAMSEAFWRQVWGDEMRGFERCRDELCAGDRQFARLDAPQLIKHAFALRTAAHNQAEWLGKRPILFYLYAEPEAWPVDKRHLPLEAREQHRSEIEKFAEEVTGDEVSFRSCSYSELLTGWQAHPSESVRAHAAAVAKRFLS